MIQDAWGWCTGMTQRDEMGREVRGVFRMGNTWILMVGSCQCMAKQIQYCKVKKKKKNLQTINVREGVENKEPSCSAGESVN